MCYPLAPISRRACFTTPNILATHFITFTILPIPPFIALIGFTMSAVRVDFRLSVVKIAAAAAPY